MEKILLTEREAEQELNRLTREMNPTGTHFTLQPDKAVSRREVLNDAVIILNGLQAFINNDHKLKGLPDEILKTFGPIICYEKRNV